MIKHWSTVHISIIAVGVLFLLGAGCGLRPPSVQNGGAPREPILEPVRFTLEEKLAAQSKIKRFSNIEEIRAFLEENAPAANAGLYGDVINRADDTMSVTETVLQDAPDYSRTNIQVEGVDEGDIAKTDGEYIYTISGNSVVVMKARPVESVSVVSRIGFNNIPSGLYIAGDRLVVYGSDAYVYTAEKAARVGIQALQSSVTEFYPSSSFTFVRIFDISDPKNPREARDIGFEGNYSSSRLIGDHLYFITSHYTYSILSDEPPIPKVFENGESIAFQKDNMPPVYYFDFPYQAYQFTTVSAMNIRESTAPITSEVYLLDPAQTMYVSPANLYLTYTKYLNEYEVRTDIARELVFPRLSEGDKERMRKIEAADSVILSGREKLNKMNAIAERYIARLSPSEQNALNEEIRRIARETYQNIARELEKTVIHKIALNGTSLAYQTSGEVPGSVLNQFSMDESGGYFRIATVKNRSWSIFLDENDAESEPYSNLYVLDSNLKVVGSLEGLAKGERMYSARFMQGRAYLVTFETIDPLFVIDVSEPAAPRVLGELKIPGFSQYLHPYDDATLIGFGRDTEARSEGGAAQNGLKLSLFDVSDVAAPREIDAYIFGSSASQSSALYDHRAFLFSRDKHVLVVPFDDWKESAFRVAAVFSVTREGFAMKGTISHGVNYQAAILRALYIGDNLYALSDQYATIHAIVDIRELNRVALQGEPK